MFFPCSPEECFSMTIEAFDFAEKFQTPTFVMTDLDLGMNNWMADGFPYPEKPIARGKVLDAEDLDRLGGFARYKDVDGDGVGYRTLPGVNHPKGSYFTRGSGHNLSLIHISSAVPPAADNRSGTRGHVAPAGFPGEILARRATDHYRPFGCVDGAGAVTPPRQASEGIHLLTRSARKMRLQSRDRGAMMHSLAVAAQYRVG